MSGDTKHTLALVTYLQLLAFGAQKNVTAAKKQQPDFASFRAARYRTVDLTAAQVQLVCYTRPSATMSVPQCLARCIATMLVLVLVLVGVLVFRFSTVEDGYPLEMVHFFFAGSGSITGLRSYFRERLDNHGQWQGPGGGGVTTFAR